MSATSTSSQPLPAGEGHAEPPVPVTEIDASCRLPVVTLFIGAVFWLLVSSVLAMIAALKFHMPTLLAECPGMTYGRVHPAQLDVFIYGFAVQAGLGAALWLLAHLGRTRLACGHAIIAGSKLWNLGVLLGLAGILWGGSTGFEWFEMPRYSLIPMFVGYVLIAIGATMTLHERREPNFYISQWFICAAIFWFPWIFTTAGLLLDAWQVRGALQAVIDWWYFNNLSNVWLAFIGLAAIFYFIPKIVRKPLHSHYLGLFIFWTLAFFASWGGVPAGAPVPSWLPALSIAAKALTIVPILGVAINIARTGNGDCSAAKGSWAFKFFMFAVVAYVIAGLAGVAAAPMRFARILEFTWFMPAQTQLFLYGFFAMAMFGAIYYIVPRLLQVEFKPGFITLQFWLAALGILLYAVPLMIGGISQGLALNDPSKSFPEIMESSLLFFRVSTTGDTLMALGHLVLFLNLAGVLVRIGKASLAGAWAENTKTAEVTS